MDYSRQVLLRQIGKAGQERLGVCSVAVVGVGAIGCLSSELLVRAGIGKLVLIDRDVVEDSNLQRQILYSAGDVGKAKAAAARESLLGIRPEAAITALISDLDYSSIGMVKSDIILDCTDNLEARFLINDFCRKNSVPWVHSAAIMASGAVFSVLPGSSNACFRCVVQDAPHPDTCDAVGVLNTVAASVSAFQVTEAFKIILGNHPGNYMLRLNMWDNDFSRISVRKNPSCLVCRGHYDYLSGKKGSRAVRLCGNGSYQIRGAPVDLGVLEKRLKRASSVRNLGYCLSLPGVSVFSDGRALVKAGSESEARSRYSRIFG
ncbi:ThiF family adenylyltransferase [Candidatus Woesearchaeota archaeon]|nr:ThiF family adenylyltransferase [Candidatus Woesearchaeota archaeon]